jgi:hypothetical protein
LRLNCFLLFSCIWISKKSYRSLVGTPIAFLITQNKLKMKKKWGFKLERFEVFFQKISNKISQFWILRLNYFSSLCCIWSSKRYWRLLVGAPIAFKIIQNELTMKKKWGFKLKRFKVFFQNIWNKISQFWNLRLFFFN